MVRAAFDLDPTLFSPFLSAVVGIPLAVALARGCPQPALVGVRRGGAAAAAGSHSPGGQRCVRAARAITPRLMARGGGLADQLPDWYWALFLDMRVVFTGFSVLTRSGRIIMVRRENLRLARLAAQWSSTTYHKRCWPIWLVSLRPNGRVT